MKRALTMEQRLMEFAEWRQSGGLQVPLGESIFGRIAREQAGAGPGGEKARFEIVEGVPCRPDGGMGRMMEMYGAQAACDSRCREIRELLPLLPELHRETLEAVYLGPERRQAREAAQLMKLSVGKFYERKAALLGWFEGALTGGVRQRGEGERKVVAVVRM